MLNASSVSDLLSKLKQSSVDFVDFRFTDLCGSVHHVTRHISSIGENEFKDGIMFDGSSISGWRAINESDMIMLPDYKTAFVDPFVERKTAVVFCSIVCPKTQKPYNRDPRTIGSLAEEYLKKSGVGDVAYFGPELEFFMFDDVKFENDMYGCKYSVDSNEFPSNHSTEFEGDNNLGHRPSVKGGYFPVSPIDTAMDIRLEMVDILNKVGVETTLAHHEVAPAQHELGFLYDTLVKIGDKSQKYKYIVQNVALSHGKSVTFMPKPVYGDNGSGMHVHQSIWSGGKNSFFGKEYADLSETALYYIGGIIKHAKALNAFTNPSTNSYKRLVPGYEAPVLLAYSAMNRSASIRIPYAGTSPNAKRIEVRFPDPSANPYLAFAAMLMAGIDGIKNKIHPGEAAHEDLYHISEAKQKKIPNVCGSLDEALKSLDKDREFLKQGDVFSDDLIDSYIALKKQESDNLRLRPHPIEFDMYYSC